MLFRSGIVPRPPQKRQFSLAPPQTQERLMLGPTNRNVWGPARAYHWLRSLRKRLCQKHCCIVEPESRRALRNACLYASTGWTRSGSDHLGHRFERRGDIFRLRFHRSCVTRHGGLVDEHNGYDFQGALRNGHKQRPPSPGQTIAKPVQTARSLTPCPIYAIIC